MLQPLKWRDSSHLYRLVEKRYLQDIAKIRRQNGGTIHNIWLPESSQKLLNYELLAEHSGIFPTFYNKINQRVEIIMFSRYSDYINSNPIAKDVKTHVTFGRNKSVRIAKDQKIENPDSMPALNGPKSASRSRCQEGGELKDAARPETTPTKARKNSIWDKSRTLPPRSYSCPVNSGQRTPISINVAPTEPREKSDGSEKGANVTKTGEKSLTPKKNRKLLKRRSEFTLTNEIGRMVLNPFANEVWYRKSAHMLKKPEVVSEEEKELTQEDIENMVRRLARPTASSKNRMKKRHVPEELKKQKHVTFETFEDDVNRFCGKRHLTYYEIEDIVDRLSEIPVRVPDNCRVIPDSMKSNMGILGSYRWQGILKY